MATYIKVAKASELPPGESTLIETEGKKIALFNVDGAYHAIDDTCTHRSGPLSEGEVDGKEVTCPWHGAIFDVTTGEALSSPASEGVASYGVRVQDGDVELEL